MNFAHDRFEGADGAKEQTAKWTRIAQTLNATGGARKSVEQWRVFYRDWRRNTKTKASNIRQQREESGVNGFRRIKDLDEQEKRLFAIMTPDAVDGDGETQERGFGSASTAPLVNIIVTSVSSENRCQTSNVSSTTTPAVTVTTTSTALVTTTPIAHTIPPEKHKYILEMTL